MAAIEPDQENPQPVPGSCHHPSIPITKRQPCDACDACRLDPPGWKPTEAARVSTRVPQFQVEAPARGVGTELRKVMKCGLCVHFTVKPGASTEDTPKPPDHFAYQKDAADLVAGSAKVILRELVDAMNDHNAQRVLMQIASVAATQRQVLMKLRLQKRRGPQVKRPRHAFGGGYGYAGGGYLGVDSTVDPMDDLVDDFDDEGADVNSPITGAPAPYALGPNFPSGNRMNDETFGAQVVKELIGAAQSITQAKSMPDLLRTAKMADEAGMDDVAAALKAQVRDQVLRGGAGTEKESRDETPEGGKA